MITTLGFLRQVKAIAATNPTYRTGGRGVDGTCDCIGLIMGAMYRLGTSKYPMHSTNYFARYETDEKQPLEGAWQLHPGMIVYKDRDDSQLNARYKPGGRYYTGDMLDYYHVGVVESTDPLVIVHCTTGGGANGILRDSALGTWSHAGFVSGGDSAPAQEAGGEPAIVAAPGGQTVNLRSRPSAKGPIIARVQVGSAVSVLESAQGWAKIQFAGNTGYMMTQFLNMDWEARLQRLEKRVAALEGVDKHE